MDCFPSKTAHSAQGPRFGTCLGLDEARPERDTLRTRAHRVGHTKFGQYLHFGGRSWTQSLPPDPLMIEKLAFQRETSVDGHFDTEIGYEPKSDTLRTRARRVGHIKFGR